MNYNNMQRSLHYLLFFVLLLQAGFVHAQSELWGVDFLTSQIFKVDGNNPAAANFVQVFKLSTMADGTNPGPLVQGSNGKLFGTAWNGGLFDKGVLFEYDPGTATYSKKIDFNGVNGNRGGWLTLAPNGKFYGATNQGGTTGQGVLFEYDPVTNTYTKKFDFDGTPNGGSPTGALTQAPNGRLYGLTNSGGASNFGVLYEYDPATSTYTKRVDFTGTGNGRNPQGTSLSLAGNGKFYGVTVNGGTSDMGVLFEFDPATNVLTKKIDFSGGADGGFLLGSLTLAGNGKLYGNAAMGGASGYGVLFEYDYTTNSYAVKHDFLPDDAGGEVWALTLAGNGKLYGVTAAGGGVGDLGTGALFEYDPTANTFATKMQFNYPTSNPVHPQSVNQPLLYTQTQTITGFAAIPDKTYGDPPFTVSATGGASGNPVTFISSDPAVATVSGNTVTIVGGGTVTITAYQLGTTTYLSAGVPQTFTVNQVGQSITFGSLADKTLGDAPFALTGTTTSGLPITYTSSNTAVATVSGSTLTIVGTGTTTITASQAGNATYFAATDVQQTLTVKLPQSISFSALTARTMGDAPLVLSATGGGSGNPVTFVSSNTSVATILGNVVTVVGAGTTTITASQAGNVSYSAAPDVPQTLTVNKGNQSITFGTLSSKNFGDGAFGLTAITSSGLPVSYASSNTSVATVSGSTVTIVGAGTTTITASQTGNASFNAATSVPQTLTVNKANQSITFGVIPVKALGDANFTLSAASTSGLTVSYASSNTSVATVSGNTVTIVGAGTATITASQAGNTNYNTATDVQQTLVVNGTAPAKTDQTITFNTLADKLVGDAAFSLTGTATSGLTVTYASSNTAVATVSGNTVTVVGAGITIITASQAGNSTFNAAVPVSRTLAVNKSNQTITFNALADKNVGDANFNLTATASSSLAVSYSSSNTSVATISGSTVTIVGVGTTVITAYQVGNGSYNAATPVSQPLTVNKTNQTITFNTLADKNVGDANFNLTATASSSLAVSYTSSNTSVATVSGNTVTIVGGGTTIITASQAGNTTYSAAPDVQQSLTVNKGNQTITFDALSARTYGDAPFALTGTASSGLAVSYVSSNTSVALVSGSTVIIVGAGSTTITASQAGNANYNTATSVPQTLTVNKANQVITFSPLPDKAVGDAPFNLTATASSGLPVTYLNGTASVATLSGSTVTIVGVGTTAFLARQSGNSNYNAATPVSQGLTVKRLNQSITFNPLPSKNVGDVPFELTATASSGLPVTYTSSNTSVATISGSTLTIVGGGSATINALQGGDDIYNSATTVALPLIVNRIDQAITFLDLPTKTVGDVPFNLTGSANSGLPLTYTSNNSSVATVSGNTVTIVGAGTATITATQAGNASYNLATPVSRLLTVNKLNQTIAFSGLASKTVGDAEFDLTATANSGLPVSFTSSNPSVATIAGSTVTIVGGGSTIITALQPGDATYNAAISVTQMLTVNKADQTITFPVLADRNLGDANFNLSATASSGLTVAYASSNTSVATVSGNTVTIVGVGTSIITASQPGNANFNAAVSVTQSLIVNKTNQSITFAALADKNVGDAAFNLTATASSGLAVAYSSSNTSVATVSGNTVTIVGAGTSIITATQAGNTGYSEAPEVSQPLTVNVGSQAITFGALSAKTYGDASFALTATASSGLPITYVSSNTSVATISGSMVNIVGAGSTTITASQAGNTNYNAATPVQQTLTINKANQTIIFNALPDQTIDEGVLILEAIGGPSGNPVTFSSSDPYTADNIGNTLIPLIGGTVTITASQAGNENYNPATDVQQTLTIHKADQEIIFPPMDNRKVGDEPFLLDAASTSGWELTLTSSNPDVATISYGYVIIVGPGTTTITASQEGSNRYNPAADVQQTLTVNKGDQTITFNTLPAKLTTDAAFDLTATVNSGLPISYASSNTSVATISGSTVTIVGPGTTTITASQAGNTNYNAAVSVPQDLTIIGTTTKTDQAITFNALADKNVGDAAFSLTASATSSLPVSYTSSNTAVATVSGNTVTIVGGGSTIITASQSGNGTYNAATPVPQLLTVNKLNQTITFNSLANKAVGDPAFSLSATTSSGLPVSYTSSNASVATISGGNTVTIVGAGTTIITASQSGDASYYPADNVSQSLMITAGSKADQVITFNALDDKTFGESDFSLSATASSTLPVSYVSSNHSVATISGNTVTITGVGITIITASQPGNTSYNAAVDVPRTLTVNKLPQTITFEALSDKTYGDPNFTLSATTSSGLPVSYESSDPSVAVISGNTVIILGVGSTTITAYQSGNSNYDAAGDVSQTLTVNKKDQTISFSSLQDRTVGDADFSLSATASSELPVSYASNNTSVVTISGNTVTIVGAGTAVITVSQQGDENYNPATEVQQTLTINDVAANQTITFNELEDKIFGDADFDLTATTSSGLPLTYVSSNSSVATVSGSTVTIVGVGTAIITASQPGNGDFLAAAEVSRTFTVSKRDQTIAFNALEDKNAGDAAFNLEATASSGLPVSYHATSDKVSVNNNEVTILKAGRATIVATQSGNATYEEAEPVNQSFCIKPVKPIITLTNTDTESPLLISSAQEGNQWFRNGEAIPDATSATFTATEPGEYSLQVTVDDCISDFSDIQALIVTGSEAYFDDRSIELYPNPASDWLIVSLEGFPGKKQVAIIQPDGKETATQEVNGDEARFRVTDYSRGVYFVRVKTGNTTRMIRFAKD